jgi:hypothetical protein
MSLYTVGNSDDPIRLKNSSNFAFSFLLINFKVVENLQVVEMALKNPMAHEKSKFSTIETSKHCPSNSTENSVFSKRAETSSGVIF